MAPKFYGKFTRTTTSTWSDFSTRTHTVVEFETDDPELFVTEATRRGYAKAHAAHVREVGSMSRYRGKSAALTAVEKEWLGQPVELIRHTMPEGTVSSSGKPGERGIVMGLAPRPKHVWVYMTDRAEIVGVRGSDLWVCAPIAALFKAGRSQRYPVLEGIEA